MTTEGSAPEGVTQGVTWRGAKEAGSWAELFFDLLFVVAVTRVSARLVSWTWVKWPSR
jgi:low temperature requirement protein LtrA